MDGQDRACVLPPTVARRRLAGTHDIAPCMQRGSQTTTVNSLTAVQQSGNKQMQKNVGVLCGAYAASQGTAHARQSSTRYCGCKGPGFPAHPHPHKKGAGNPRGRPSAQHKRVQHMCSMLAPHRHSGPPRSCGMVCVTTGVCMAAIQVRVQHTHNACAKPHAWAVCGNVWEAIKGGVVVHGTRTHT
jgi:hypothetical protein